MRALPILALLALIATPVLAAGPPMVMVRETDVMRPEKPPHNGEGMSAGYRISDAEPNRTMEFRKRVLHSGASIGLHVIAHDEVY